MIYSHIPHHQSYIKHLTSSMPELPEVETMRRGILAAIGSRVVDAEKLRCSRKPIEISPPPAKFRRRVRGATITELDRAGKRVVIWLDTDDAIVIEPRMTGLVLVADAPTQQHLRWRLQLAGGPLDEILYWDRRGLGNVRLFSRKEFDARFGLEKLGPDALQITAEEYRERLGRSRREIKPALLDQRAVAGIGNLYASEILHVAGIHPRRSCAVMTANQWQALTAATHAVLEDAVRYEGSTLGDGTYRNALNQEGGYQNEHRVYDRADQPCLRCQTAKDRGKNNFSSAPSPFGRGQGEGTSKYGSYFSLDPKIKRIVQTQRSTFFCAKCQKRSGAIVARLSESRRAGARRDVLPCRPE